MPPSPHPSIARALLLAGVLLAGASSCVQQRTTQLAPSSPQLNNTLSPQPPRTVETRALPAPAPTALLASLSGLPPGQYLIVASLENPSAPATEGAQYSVYAVTLNGEISGPIAYGPGPGSALSPDGTQIAYPSSLGGSGLSSLFIYDLNSHALSTVPGEFNTSVLAWSPDGSSLLTQEYPQSGQTGLEVQTIDPRTGGQERLSYCQALYPDASCYQPSWSPNGALLEFALASGDQLGSKEIGVYILDAACLSQPVDCLKKARGPFTYGESAKWSPDSLQLAFNAHEAFAVFAITTSEVKWLTVPEGRIDSFAWSPSGDRIAFTQGGDGGNVIHLIDTKSGVVERIPRFIGSAIHIIGWLTTSME